MAAKLEIERKYDVPADFTLPHLTELPGVAAVGEPDEHRLDAVYYDTPRLRLTRRQVTLRRRTGGTDAGWHLKRPVGGERSELQLPAKADRRRPPRAITEEVRALVRGEPLKPVVRIRTRRVERPLRAADGTTLALLAEDEVAAETLRDGGEPQRWRELEVELVDGSVQVLDAVDAALRAAGARPAQSPSKLVRALGDKRPTAAKRGYGAAHRALTDYLLAQRDAIVANDRGVRDGDPTAVHRMRVATRRLRSTLRTFAPLLTGDVDRLHDEAKWLTGALGAVRDGDVMADRLAAAVAAEPPELVLGPVAARIHQHLSHRTAEARTQLEAALDSPRYAALIDAIGAAADAPPATRITRDRLRRLAHKAVLRADRRLATVDRVDRSGRTTDAPSMPGGLNRNDRLHEARKSYKRARYAIELVGPLAKGPAKRLADRLTELQDVLGAHQDSIVTGQLLRQYGIKAHLAGENAFTYGLLHARQHDAGLDSLRRLPAARRRIGVRKVRRWLD